MLKLGASASNGCGIVRRSKKGSTRQGELALIRIDKAKNARKGSR
jgi:hypothetical protein